jgi:hypothetical protein
MKDTERLLLDDLFRYVHCVSQDERFTGIPKWLVISGCAWGWKMMMKTLWSGNTCYGVCTLGARVFITIIAYYREELLIEGYGWQV